MKTNWILRLAEEFLEKTSAKSSFKYTEFDDGIIINGSCLDLDVVKFVENYLGKKKVTMIHSDPPYGNIVSDKWDKTKMSQQQFADWMVEWTKLWYPLVHDGGAIYIWGGTGIPNFRPFYVYTTQIESNPDLDIVIKDVITWSKKRAFGKKYGYLYTREECLFMQKIKDINPKVFNIPLTDKLRGYTGFGKYEAKSPYLRRTNIWSVTEKFSGKEHPTEKPISLCRIPIEASSNKGDYILDMFGGSFSTAAAAREAGRKFIIIEKDPIYYKNGVRRMKNFKRGDKY